MFQCFSSLLSLGQHKRGFPFPHLLSIPSSLPCIVYQGQELYWHDLHFILPLAASASGQYTINPSPASSSPCAFLSKFSVRVINVAIRLSPQLSIAGCARLCPGHWHQRHRFWYSMLLRLCQMQSASARCKASWLCVALDTS
jgi:hypothetical protein